MPNRSRAEQRPADAIGTAATGDGAEANEISSAAASLGSRGGKARAEKMSPERRKEIAQKAAQTRWTSNTGGGPDE